ncbi:hypothetical protein ACWGH5_37195 [Streptomyces sp. NPDC054864]
MAEQWNFRASGQDPLLELQVGDAAFVDAGVERGGNALDGCGLMKHFTTMTHAYPRISSAE